MKQKRMNKGYKLRKKIEEYPRFIYEWSKNEVVLFVFCLVLHLYEQREGTIGRKKQRIKQRLVWYMIWYRKILRIAILLDDTISFRYSDEVSMNFILHLLNKYIVEWIRMDGIKCWKYPKCRHLSLFIIDQKKATDTKSKCL